ncbi:secreted RxLR effector protein 161-like [Lathyrus oleraceus]|uniref:secreted RxLR effector protein 161-like n=1 Tax=Pisum sativum TaxID=3888 RepID=UPI0021CEE11D|nr:secreted RxLR effector protein 161-like [Pisum sativum]
MKEEFELLKRFKLLNCKVVVTPADINQKLDFDFDGDDVDATTFKQFMSKPKWSHYQVVVRIMRYIKETLKYEVLFPSGVETESELLSYSYSDWYGDRVDRISTPGYLFKFMGSSISWCSKKKPIVALSTCEAEYIARVVTAYQVVWLLNLLQDLKIKVSKPLKLMVDNKSAINLAKNPVLHGRSKHIETKYHILRNHV